MKLKRKIYATLMALPTILTFRKYYLCEECHKLHRFTGNEFTVFGGWWEPYIYVNRECSEKMLNRVATMLFSEALKDMKKGK